MKIGILITSISNFGKKGFYNSQEIGLAKALAKYFETVEVFKLVPINQTSSVEYLEKYKNVQIKYVPAKNSGINGVMDTTVLEPSLTALIHFSDTQFSVPSVYQWCKKKCVQYIPYIGVVESHSTNNIKKCITNLMFKRNIAVYRKCMCCVKTPMVQEKIKKLGISNSIVTPVGLDLDLLKQDYETFSSLELKQKYGYRQEDKVLLFIGRLIDEKQPVRMINILGELKNQGHHYKLLMVGSGELELPVKKRIKELHLENDVKMLESIPNENIWELYCLSEAFVNLNQQEIFGMAILEAMYYGCKVIAWSAPGPDYIIENGVSGFLATTDKAICACIMKSWNKSQCAHNRIVEEFVWDRMAKVLKVYIGGLFS